jgi:SAM-dependent methyltransferase
MRNWQLYTDKTKNKPPRELLVQALEFVKEKKMVLDLGAGALNDTKFMLNVGFEKIIAVDGEENLETLNELDEKIVSFMKCQIEKYDFPINFFDLINAQFVLPFIVKEELLRVIKEIKNSLKNEGIFVGQFFGSRDSWATRADVFVYTQEEVKQFFTDMEIIYFKEEENDGQALLEKEKHWHIFHFIVKKIKI